MLRADELRRCAAERGVPEAQIVRDHLISHLLRTLADVEAPDVTFFGGTALCRTWCRDTRLSEDVDLLVDDHVEASRELTSRIARGLRREYPDMRWIDIDRRHQVDTKRLEVAGGASL